MSNNDSKAFAPAIHFAILPTVTKFLSVGEIPAWTSLIVYPDPPIEEGSEVTDISKHMPGAGRPVPLTDDDWVTLREVWSHLPEIRFRSKISMGAIRKSL